MDPDEIRLEQARIEHAGADSGAEAEYKMVESFANAAMKAPGITGAGGIAALLAFFSANASGLRDSEVISEFNHALTAFFIAILLTVLAPALAYLSQIFFTSATSSRERTWVHPYVVETSRSKNRWFIAECIRWLAMVIVCGAIIACCMGAWHFYQVAKFVAGS